MYDLLLKNGCVVDGSRGKPYHANVCVQDGRFARITSVREIPEAEEVLDVSGLVVAPGLIDIYSHSDA